MATFNEKILDVRINQNAYIKTILKMMIEQEPMLDELVLCKWVTNALDSKNLPYSRKEIRTAIKPYHNSEFHGDLSSYVNFLSENCSKKVVHISKLKNGAQASKKRAVAVTTDTQKGSSLRFSDINGEIPTNTHLNEIRGLK
jgi:adenine-specific DNA methylase